MSFAPDSCGQSKYVLIYHDCKTSNAEPRIPPIILNKSAAIDFACPSYPGCGTTNSRIRYRHSQSRSRISAEPRRTTCTKHELVEQVKSHGIGLSRELVPPYNVLLQMIRKSTTVGSRILEVFQKLYISIISKTIKESLS